MRAGIDGVLQLVPVEVGQRVTPGHEPGARRAARQAEGRVRIPETQAKDVVPGQKAAVDTRNGIVEGARDPHRPGGAERHGDGRHRARRRAAASGARPDLTVDGTIELERLRDVLYVGRPAMGQPQSTVGLFRLVKGTNEAAARAGARSGRRRSARSRSRRGSTSGDQVILSDTSAWDAADRIRLN